MPRDGSNIYSQPFPDVVEDTTIESTVYNGFTNDVAADLNAARPIVAGGTGATNADQALFNLAAEKATQVVTNYDSHLWVPGSFRSAAGATGAPTVNAFAGTAIIGEALANPPTNQNVVLEARDLGDASVPGLKYIREKTAGVWSAWALDVGSQAIRYDTDQTLTEAQKAQGRENIYAAPFDALAYNGMQINGSMEVNQPAAGLINTGYFMDGWQAQKTGTGVLAFNQYPAVAAADFLGIAQFFAGITVPTPQATMLAADFFMILQNIEGYRVSRLNWGTANAQPLTIGFWVSHSVTGTYSVAVRNLATTRSYVATYTQNVASVPEYKTITVPGCVDGVWKADNTPGITLSFCLACGSTYTAPAANVWQSGNYIAASGQANLAASGAVGRLTGVLLLPGIEAPSAARSPLIMRPYDQELLTCQRYYQQIQSGWAGGFDTPTRCVLGGPFLGVMRIAPVATVIGNPTVRTMNTTIGTTAATIAVSAMTTTGGTVAIDSWVGGTTGAAAACTMSTPWLKLDARL